MRFILIALFILINLIIIKTSTPTVPYKPWPPQVPYTSNVSTWLNVAKTNFLKPREYQSVVYDMFNNRLIIIGGKTANGTYLNDVWAWTFVGQRFYQIFPSGERFPARAYHIAGMDVVGRRLFVFGGMNSDGTLGDFWQLTLNSGTEKWIPICTKNVTSSACNKMPSARWGGFGGSWVGNSIATYFFVSHGKSGFADVKGDTWAYNMRSGNWTNITGKDGNQGRFVVGLNHKSPSPRFLALATITGPDSLAIYGGCGAGGFGACPNSDGWLMIYNTTTNIADWVKFSSCPIRSYKGQATVKPGTNSTSTSRFSQPIFFGGYGGTVGGGYHSSNIFEIYDTISTLSGQAKWARTFLLSLRNNPLNTPNGRTGASMLIIHPAGIASGSYDFVVFFGGRDRHSTVRSDLWYLTGQSLLGRRYKCQGNTDYRMIHGSIMFVAFGVLFPISIMLARFGKDSFLPRLREKSPWLWFHGIANVLGSVLAIPGLVIGIVAVNTAHFTSLPHAYLGIIAFAFVMFNPIWGLIRPKNKDASSRPAWAYVHFWIGRLAIILAFINMLLGILMIRANVIILALYIVYIALYIIIFIVLFLVFMKKSGDSCGKALNPKYDNNKFDY